MFVTPTEAKRLANARAIAVYPGTDLEILGYTTENGQSFAFIRRGGNSGRICKVNVRYNGHCEPYCSLSINGHRQHVYLNDCRRCVQ